ncbi:MAG: amidohydrolase family protein [Helicobacteraceae bacterium]|jgi:dihydroorotase|nr:amidohydrolase family protein [Helicobacteraceae bacterium]
MLITNALLIDADTYQKGALRIENGQIAELGDGIKPYAGEEVLDIKGKYLLPGLVDLDFHLNDPGHKRIETIEESGRNATGGGITTVLASSDTSPPIDNETVVEYILTKAVGVRFLLSGEIAKGVQMNNIAKLFSVGIAALDGASSLESNILRRAFQYALMGGKTVFISCKNSSLEMSGVIHDGLAAADLGLPSMPDFAESSEALKTAEIAGAIGAKLLIKAISSKRTITALKPHKTDRLFLQTLLPHLLLTDEDLRGFNTSCKIFPPLRSQEDQDALIAALKSGEIDVLSSGHFPQDESSRDRPFELSSAGMDIAGIFLSLAHTFLISAGKLTIHEFLRAASKNPAKVLNLPCGELKSGTYADLVIFDPQKQTTVKPRRGIAKSYWSAQTLKGAVTGVFLNGRYASVG